MNHMPELVNKRPRGRPPKAQHDNISDFKTTYHRIRRVKRTETKRQTAQIN